MKQYPQINFGYLITQYTREFRTGYVEAAIDYFTLICLNADLPGALGKSQSSVCHEALREFILETRDFAKLLGDIRADGTRIKGVIEQRLDLINLVDQQDFLKSITIQAAGVADDKGLITDAVLLYHLAENYDRVIDIVNRALSDAIAVELGGTIPKLQPLRPRVEHGQEVHQTCAVEPGSSLSLTTVDDPVVLGKNMIGLYSSNQMYLNKVRQINRDACGLLLRTMEAKTEVEAGRWAPALDVSVTNMKLCSMSFEANALYRLSTDWVSFHCKPEAQCHTSEAPPRLSRPSRRSSRATLDMSSCGVLRVSARNVAGRLQGAMTPICTRVSRNSCSVWPRISWSSLGW